MKIANTNLFGSRLKEEKCKHTQEENEETQFYLLAFVFDFFLKQQRSHKTHAKNLLLLFL